MRAQKACIAVAIIIATAVCAFAVIGKQKPAPTGLVITALQSTAPASTQR